MEGRGRTLIRVVGAMRSGLDGGNVLDQEEVDELELGEESRGGFGADVIGGQGELPVDDLELHEVGAGVANDLQGDV